MTRLHAIRHASILLIVLAGASACPSSSPGSSEPPGPAPAPEVPAQPPEPDDALGVDPLAVDGGAAAPGPNEPAAPGLVPTEPIAVALQRVPASVAARYVLSISADRQELTIDPAPPPVRRDARSRGFSARDSENGGKVITLEGGPFRHAGWVQASFRQRVTDPARLEQLRGAGYDVDQPRDLLVVDGELDRSPTVFAFSADATKPGIVGVCSDVTIIDFGLDSGASAGLAAGKPSMVAVRKPVIYLYPETTTRVHVELEVQGELIATYPALPEDGWVVTASPSGELVDEATGRRHRYLFWEARSAGWELDPARAHCVPGTEAATFLEGVCSRFALTPDECGDFVTYWLPTLASNPYSVIELVDEQTYGRYAQLRVEPAPDTVIRPFMILRRSDEPVEVGAPELPQRRRAGFTVVEWGGADLDAGVAGPRGRR